LSKKEVIQNFNTIASVFYKNQIHQRNKPFSFKEDWEEPLKKAGKANQWGNYSLLLKGEE